MSDKEVQPIIGHRRYLLEAEFEDGFIYKSDHQDVSLVDPKRNAFFDIREGLVALHGRLTKFSIISQMGKGTQNHHIDFTKLPAHAKPVYYIKRARDTTVNPKTGDVIRDVVSDKLYGFGYEYMDENGEKKGTIIEVA